MGDDGALTLRQARARYFARAGFDEGSYTERWVVIRLRGIPVLAFPNTAGRVRAIRRHDLHHVLTGYDTTLRGEGEVGAFELASGCRDYLAAWVLNTLAALGAVFVAPGAVVRAFRRGRRARNLYHEPWNDAWLDEPVAALRTRLEIPPA